MPGGMRPPGSLSVSARFVFPVSRINRARREYSIWVHHWTSNDMWRPLDRPSRLRCAPRLRMRSAGLLADPGVFDAKW